MHDQVCPPKRMRFSFESRCRLVSLVLAGESPQAAAAACGASRATGYRLWRRYQEGGWGALRDRPPVPRASTAAAARGSSSSGSWRHASSRRQALLIVAGQLGLPASTVWKVLRRYGVSRLRGPARGPVVRYERERPGELVHVDIKKLGRFWTVGKRIHGDRLARNRRAGWQYLHLAIDDHSRLAYAELLPSESPTECVAFLRRSVGWYRETRHHRRTRPQRQRQRLPLVRLGGHLRRARDRPPLHPAPPAADQRQSRSARQDPAARVGLPLRLPHKRSPRPSPPRLPALVQPSTDRTAHSAAGHRSAASHRSVGPTPSPSPESHGYSFPFVVTPRLLTASAGGHQRAGHCRPRPNLRAPRLFRERPRPPPDGQSCTSTCR